MENLEAKVIKLKSYISSLDDFEIITELDTYNHIGAVVVDGILQAGMKYEVVKKRVLVVLEQYPAAITASSFKAICDEVGLEKMMGSWKGPKYARIENLLDFLVAHRLETVEQLRDWLREEDNRQLFMLNPGIGKVTTEYFRILVGDNSVKIDIHIRSFLMRAGLTITSDEEAIMIVSGTAEKMGTQPAVLDYSIWNFARTHTDYR